jgi:hypothetical protein
MKFLTARSAPSTIAFDSGLPVVLLGVTESGIDRVAEQEVARALAKSDALAARSVEDILNLYIANHIGQKLKQGTAREERKPQLRTFWLQTSDQIYSTRTGPLRG